MRETDWILLLFVLRDRAEKGDKRDHDLWESLSKFCLDNKLISEER